MKSFLRWATGLGALLLSIAPLTSLFFSPPHVSLPLQQRPGILASALFSQLSERGHSFFVSPKPALHLALKFVELISPVTGKTALKKEEALLLVQRAGQFFKECGIELHLDRFELAHATDYQIPYEIDSIQEFNEVRKAFQDPKRLLMIHTGSWDHQSLGPAQAWTPLPSSDAQALQGTVMEDSVANHPALTAHEIAHALGLEHREDRKNLMHPILGKDSMLLEKTQCEKIRARSRMS